MPDLGYEILKTRYPTLTEPQYFALRAAYQARHASPAAPAGPDTAPFTPAAPEATQRLRDVEAEARRGFLPGHRLVDSFLRAAQVGEEGVVNLARPVLEHVAPDFMRRAETLAESERQPLYWSHLAREAVKDYLPPTVMGGNLLPIPSAAVGAVGGLAADIAGDPLTYLTMGGTGVGRIIGEGGLGVSRAARMVADAEHAVAPEVRFMGQQILPRAAQVAGAAVGERIDRPVRAVLTASELGPLFNKSFRPAGVTQEAWDAVQRGRQAGRAVADIRKAELLQEANEIFKGVSRDEANQVRQAAETMQDLPDARLQAVKDRYTAFLDRLYNTEEAYGLQRPGAYRRGYAPHIEERGLRKILIETAQLSKVVQAGGPEASRVAQNAARAARAETLTASAQGASRYADLLRASRVAQKFGFGMRRLRQGTLDQIRAAGWTNYIMDAAKALKVRAVSHAENITAQDFVVNALKNADVAERVPAAGAVRDVLEEGAGYYLPRIEGPGAPISVGRDYRALEAITPEQAREMIAGGRPVYHLNDQVAQAINQVGALHRDPGAAQELLGVWDWWTNLWKVHTLNLFPAYYFRNAVGDFSRNWMVGLKDPSYYGRALQALHGRALPAQVPGEAATTVTELYREAQQTGALKGFLRGEIGIDTPTWNPLSKNFKPIRFMAGIGDVMERTGRFAHYLWRRETGMSPEAARKSIAAVLFDYGDMAPADRAIRRVIPFWSWTRYNLPFQLRLAMMKPGEFADLAKVQRAVEAQAGTPPRDEQVPEWMDTALPVRIRKAKTGADVYEYFVLGSWLPAADAVRLFDRNAVMDLIHPTIISALEAAQNVSNRLSGEYQHEPVKKYPGGKEMLFGRIPVDPYLANTLRRHSRYLAEAERGQRDIDEGGVVGGLQKTAARFGAGMRLFPVDQNRERARREREVQRAVSDAKWQIEGEMRRKAEIEKNRRAREAAQ